MNYKIEKAVVLGSGVMGSGIAAHLANAGIKSLMLDIVPQKLTEQETAKGLTLESKEVRNRFSKQAKNSLLKSKPALLYSSERAKYISVGNFEDDWDKLKDADWIIEVVKEDLAIKQGVFKKIAEAAERNTIISSNTSGLSIKKMLDGIDEDFKRRFLVTHFFNPVRYMKLLEIIPSESTDRNLVDFLTFFAEKKLGKGVVFAKDTPNFIANRIGIFGMMSAMRIMLEEGLTVEEVDKILGPASGRPKSAAFRTADMVGLDVLLAVAKTVYDNCPDDENRDVFNPPEFLTKMIANGWLGDKTKQGFYKKVGKGETKEILSIDTAILDYKPQKKVDFASLKSVKNIEKTGERIKALINSDDAAGRYAWRVISDTLLYAAGRIPEISDDIVNVDRAMRWGFNWESGPFETWDAIGITETVERMQKEGKKIPSTVEEFLSSGRKTFYLKKDGEKSYFDVKTKKDAEIKVSPEIISLSALKEQKKIVFSNMGASLVDIGDGVACLEFHTKMNAIDADIVEMVFKSVDEVEKNFEGLVLANEGENFSAGANLMLIFMEASQKNWDNIAKAVSEFQNACMRLRYSSKPVCAAPFAVTVGGGCEISMGADIIQGAAELYMGLVEVGVGLVPAGGGTKEMLIRNTEFIPKEMNIDLFPFVRRAFETIGLAKISMSGEEAKNLGFLKQADRVSINRDHLLYDAKNIVLGMAMMGYRQPEERDDITVLGNPAFSALKLGLYTMQKGGYISEHDLKIGEKVACILTGGSAAPGSKLSERDLLDLEKEAFLSLCGEQKTLDRVQHMLMKGKPLRN